MGTVLILAALASGASAPEQCRRIHYTADGRVVETRVMLDGNGASASARSNGAGGSSSSVSVSSSSDGVSSASSSASSDGQGRSVSVRRDANGCTVVVDDRPGPGSGKE